TYLLRVKARCSIIGKSVCQKRLSRHGLLHCTRSGRFLTAEPGNIECWQKDECQDCPDKQSSHDGEGHRSPENRRGDWNHAETCRDHWQQDRPETCATRVDRCLPNVFALTSFSFDLAYQDHGVLGDHAQQRQDSEDGDESKRLSG